jgi:hypothetical protein
MADREVEAEACSYHLPALRAQLHVTLGWTDEFASSPDPEAEDMFDAADTLVPYSLQTDKGSPLLSLLSHQIGKSVFRTVVEISVERAVGRWHVSRTSRTRLNRACDG